MKAASAAAALVRLGPVNGLLCVQQDKAPVLRALLLNGMLADQTLNPIFLFAQLLIISAMRRTQVWESADLIL